MAHIMRNIHIIVITTAGRIVDLEPVWRSLGQ